jgi:hypothetical protein
MYSDELPAKNIGAVQAQREAQSNCRLALQITNLVVQARNPAGASTTMRSIKII